MKPGDIVLIAFPFSDQSQQKVRPCLVIQKFQQDLLLCPLSTQPHKAALPLSSADLSQGDIAPQSSLRHWKLATLEKHQIIRTVARLKPAKLQEIIVTLQAFLTPKK